MKNNNKIFLEKLIKSTEDKTIKWKVSFEKSYNPWSGHQRIFRWKGEKKITNDKYVYFLLKCDSYNINESEIVSYFINEKEKTSSIIFKLSPGVFTFKVNKLMKKLINIIISIDKETYKNNTNDNTNKELPKKKEEDYEYEGPLKSKWDGYDDDDDDIKIKKFSNNKILQEIKEKGIPSENIVNFHISNRGLENLHGIEKLKSLTYLNCSNNNLKGLVELENLTDIVYLFCQFNKLDSLQGIENLSKLKELYCSYNNLTSIDEIMGLPNIKTIWCMKNNFSQEYINNLKEYCKNKNINLTI